MVYSVLDTLKCFDTEKNSSETPNEAEYKLNNITVENGQP